MIWEPLQQEPAFQALDTSGQQRAVEVFRHLIRSSSLTAPVRAYAPPPGLTHQPRSKTASLAERLRAARERVARLRGESRPLPNPGILPGTAGLNTGSTLDQNRAAAQKAMSKPLPDPISEQEGYLAALRKLPTQHAEGPRRPKPAAPVAKPTPRPAPQPVLPPPAPRATAAAPPAPTPTVVRDPSAPLNRPTLGGAGVTVQPAGEGAWEGIAAGELQPVPWGTVVRTSRTDRGRVMLPGNRGTVHLEPSTEVKLVPGWIRLIRGELRLHVPGDTKSDTEVRTPKGRLKVGPGGEARVRPGGFARVKAPVRRVG